MDKLTINDEVSVTADGFYTMLSTSRIPDLHCKELMSICPKNIKIDTVPPC